MPAIQSEIEDALQEDVNIEYLAAPREILREGGRVRALIVQKMQLAEPDQSGNGRGHRVIDQVLAVLIPFLKQKGEII